MPSPHDPLRHDPSLGTEPPPVGAFASDQHAGTVGDLDGVLRVWLSSVRPLYRRPVRGRSTLLELPGPVPRPRRVAM